ncbi:autophagy-related protein 18h-like [Apium graveolens]|uniref:autophagy-related protein 18h-like n=1 Tax=Apium graveolens TaxID=4045 RepID=UPI003D798F4B
MFLVLAPRAQMQPIPAKCDGCEGFMDLHPLLLVVASEKTRCSDPVQHGRDSSLRDKYEPRVGAVIHSLTAIHFYSLRSHSYVHVLRFRSAMYMVRCSSKLVAIGLATQDRGTYGWYIRRLVRLSGS